jgi:ABC-type uncharacterized transport system involved in gliding motility auxiliary subunit
MKPALFILPFLALLIGALGQSIGTSFAEQGIIFKSIGWGIAAALVAVWVYLDRANFKNFFSRKGAKYGASSGAVVILAIAVIIGIAVITSKPRFDKTYDVTKDKLNTLSEQSVNSIETLSKRNQEITITAFFVDQQQQQQFKDTIGLYLNRGAKFNVEYVDPQKDPTRAMAEKLTSPNTVVFRLGQQEQKITTFSEEKITNALVGVLKDKLKKVYFTKGHGESPLKGNGDGALSVIDQELQNNRFEVSEISLLETAKVPDDASVLIIAGPKYELKQEEIRFIEDYLNKGGALLVMLDAMTPTGVINNMLQKYGVVYNDDILILRPDDPRSQLLGQNNAIVSEFDEFSSVTKDFAKKSNVALLLQNTRSLTEVSSNEKQMKVSLIGKTSDAGVRVKNVVNANNLKGAIAPDRIEAGSFPVIATATGKIPSPVTASAGDKANDEAKDVPTEEKEGNGKEVRIAMVGSATFISNSNAQREENRDMFVNMVNYLAQDEDFITIRPKDPTKSSISLTSPASNLTLLLLSFVYPFLFLGSGVLHWLRRRQA